MVVLGDLNGGFVVAALCTSTVWNWPIFPDSSTSGRARRRIFTADHVVEAADQFVSK